MTNSILNLSLQKDQLLNANVVYINGIELLFIVIA